MNKKTLVIVPGFRGSSKEIQFVDMQKRALKYDINTIIIDWPFWKSENMDKYTMSSTLGAVDKVMKQLSKDNSDIVLVGESLGGIIATYIASKYKLKGLILLVTPIRFMSGDDMEEKRIEWKERNYKEFVSKSTGDTTIVPYSFVEDADTYNALPIIKKVTCPISYIVGLSDESVPNHLTRALYDATATPKEWIEVDGMTHTYRTQADKMDIVDSSVVDIAVKHFLLS